MGSEWPDSELGTFIRLQRGHDLTDSQRKPGNVPVMGSAGQNGFHDTSKAKGPGIVLGRSGASFGKVHYTPDDYWPHNTALYVTDFQGNDELFTYFFLKTIDFTSYNTGSAQPSLNRNHLYSIPVNIPPLPEQKAIAHILGTLDDKIELNRRMNATLEGMAQALFKSWFVDFDPVIDNALAAGNPIPDELAPRAEVRKNALASSGEPSRTNGATQQGSVDHPTLSDPKSLFPAAFQFTEELGWIPEGWNTAPLSRLAKVSGGKQLDKSLISDAHEFPVFGGAGLMGYTQAPNACGEVITFGRVGAYCGQFVYHSGDCWVNNNASRVEVHEGVPSKWLFRALVNIDLDPIKRGAAQPFISNGDLLKEHILIPAAEVQLEFEMFSEAAMEKQRTNAASTESLMSIRDTLLPKLISGELRATRVEQEAKEVAS